MKKQKNIQPLFHSAHLERMIMEERPTQVADLTHAKWIVWISRTFLLVAPLALGGMVAYIQGRKVLDSSWVMPYAVIAALVVIWLPCYCLYRHLRKHNPLMNEGFRYYQDWNLLIFTLERMGLYPSELDNVGDLSRIANAINSAAFVPLRLGEFLDSECDEVTNLCREKAWALLGLRGYPILKEIPSEDTAIAA